MTMRFYATLQRELLENGAVFRAVQMLCSLVAGLVLILGIKRLAELELNEAQVFFGSLGVIGVTGVFIMLGFILRLISEMRHAGAGQP